jgi:RNA polymerase sigma factor for flagellar operon FliA
VLKASTMTTAEMNQIAIRFIPRIQKIARGVCRQLPAHVEADDLAQAGIVGMMTALKSFDPARGDCVDVYITRRVRGAILDELRALDPLSRDQRRDARAIQTATRALEGELGRAPAEDEVAEKAGLLLDRVRAVRELASAAAPVSLDETLHDPDARSIDPVERLSVEELRCRLETAVADLSKREQTVIALYYVEELSLKEIGGLLGVTESRVCQIHGAAVKKLRAAMAQA